MTVSRLMDALDLDFRISLSDSQLRLPAFLCSVSYIFPILYRVVPDPVLLGRLMNSTLYLRNLQIDLYLPPGGTIHLYLL